MKKRDIANSLIIGGFCLVASGIVLKRRKHLKKLLAEAIKEVKKHCK